VTSRPDCVGDNNEPLKHGPYSMTLDERVAVKSSSAAVGASKTIEALNSCDTGSTTVYVALMEIVPVQPAVMSVGHSYSSSKVGSKHRSNDAVMLCVRCSACGKLPDEYEISVRKVPSLSASVVTSRSTSKQMRMPVFGSHRCMYGVSKLTT